MRRHRSEARRNGPGTVIPDPLRRDGYRRPDHLTRLDAGKPPPSVPWGVGADASPHRRPGRVRLLWMDLVVGFTAYVLGLLVAGLALGGDQARDVAVGNLVGVGLAVVTVTALVLWRRYRR